jgi:hypothetical protein
LTKEWTTSEIQKRNRVLRGKPAKKGPPAKSVIKRYRPVIKKCPQRIRRYRTQLKAAPKEKQREIKKKLWKQQIIRGGNVWYNNRVKHLRN